MKQENEVSNLDRCLNSYREVTKCFSEKVEEFELIIADGGEITQEQREEMNELLKMIDLLEKRLFKEIMKGEQKEGFNE